MISIYIITDMEGISGIADRSTVAQSAPDHAYACRRLMADTNAAIDGAFAGGADEVFVVDGHGGGHNFLPGQLDSRAVQCGMSTAEVDFSRISAFMHVGAHAMAGTPGAFYDHTQSSVTWKDYRVNGRSGGELVQAGLFAGAYGIPYIMVAGDTAACREGREFFGDIRTAAVKTAIDSDHAQCLPEAEAEALIYRAAKESIALIGKIPPYRVEMPLDIQVEFRTKEFCDAHHAARPQFQRINDLTLRRVTDNIVEYADVLF